MRLTTPDASAVEAATVMRDEDAGVVPIVESDGRLTPLQRLEELCDEGSLTLLRSDVVSKRMGAKARAGDGVIAGAGRVDVFDAELQ